MQHHVRRRGWAWVRSAVWSAVWLVALLAALVLCPLTCTRLTEGRGYVLYVLVERLLNQSPQARLAEYMRAVSRGDGEAAMACWRADAARLAGGEVRRAGVTQELLELGGVGYDILEVQWWSTWCCVPCVAQDPRSANVAFLRVEVAGREYVFEARARNLLGGDPRVSTPVRGWALGDVFRGDGRPLDAQDPPHYWSYYSERTP